MKFPVRTLPALLVLCLACTAYGQAAQTQPLTPQERDALLRQLHQQLDDISRRLQALEVQSSAQPASAASSSSSAGAAEAGAAAPVVAAATPAPPVASADATTAAQDRDTLTFFRGTSINLGVDGYYNYNFNQPLTHVNQLRAYDLSANSFSINQATVMVEHLPVAEPGKRFGGRIDLQFGQATETLQGSSANELNPEVWRDLFQAYGSYLAPVGSGLRVDFGKFASSLGAEGNYTKDQINYSRGFLFDYLPFYHTGFRANYDLTSKVNFAFWLVNGAQQTEDFNSFKSQGFLFTLKPAKSVVWNVNYYTGQEQRAILTAVPAGSQEPPTPNGREHIFDTYSTWTVTPRLTLVGEADFVVDRVYSNSMPARVAIGAFYARYQMRHGNALGARTEYLDDRGGLFSNSTQALKEFTATFEHQFQPGFLTRVEYRRDFSNQHFFLTPTQGVLNTAQGTATLGLVYWWGTKQGTW